ncbi:hypothetical protein N9C08_02510 [Rubripirellula sp.]|nr:hypothetical protein [Rhodopirellula sp.]MDA9840687.1 hypothetical protein [Rubripirellula sp.]
MNEHNKTAAETSSASTPQILSSSLTNDTCHPPNHSAKGVGGVIPVCPVCGGNLIDIRAKLQCERCHRICETCCEGGRG